MGAERFSTTGSGKTVDDAFDAARDQAFYDYGHSGYSGSLAEKTDFVEISVPEGQDPEEFAENLMDNADPRIRDKWGPAGAVLQKHGVWLFFGWASS